MSRLLKFLFFSFSVLREALEKTTKNCFSQCVPTSWIVEDETPTYRISNPEITFTKVSHFGKLNKYPLDLKLFIFYGINGKEQEQVKANDISYKASNLRIIIKERDRKRKRPDDSQDLHG